jgi:hypothetical protein
MNISILTFVVSKEISLLIFLFTFHRRRNMEQELPSTGNFLKHVSFPTNILSLLRLYLKVTPIPSVSLNGNRYRVTNDGGIESSSDAGKTWVPSADFRPPHHIWGLTIEGDDLVAAIDHTGHTILINSEDGKVWYNHPVED